MTIAPHIRARIILSAILIAVAVIIIMVRSSHANACASKYTDMITGDDVVSAAVYMADCS